MKKPIPWAVASIAVLICCFTPLLVIIFSLVGLTFIVPYLDYILFPLLALCILGLALSIIQKCATDKKVFVCPACGIKYANEGMRDRCRAWCEEHHSCNLEIIKNAIQEK